MRSICLFVVLVVAVGTFWVHAPGGANDAPIKIMGGAASPAGPHQTIRMESEEVVIRLRRNSYTVDAVFHFFNTGKTEIVPVGFPIHGAGAVDRLRELADDIHFLTWVDGKKVTPSERRDFSDGHGLSAIGLSSRAPEGSKWLVKNVTFPGQRRTTTRVRYEIAYDDWYAGSDAHYVYGTGSYWKGSIGLAAFTIDSSEIGKLEDLQVLFLPPDDTGHLIRKRVISENLVRYEIRDFEPAHDGALAVTFRAAQTAHKKLIPGDGKDTVAQKRWIGRYQVGEVVAFSAESLSIRSDVKGSPKLITVKIGKKTRFMHGLRPAVGEKVEVLYQDESEPRVALAVSLVDSDVSSHGARKLTSPTGAPHPPVMTLVGEVIASLPKELSVESRRAAGEPETEVIAFKVGLKTRFIPFRRPDAGETVEVEYRTENGRRFAYQVKVIE